jgi:hypothetical protein
MHRLPHILVVNAGARERLSKSSAKRLGIDRHQNVENGRSTIAHTTTSSTGTTKCSQLEMLCLIQMYYSIHI